MNSRKFDLPELVRTKALLRGDAGRRWLEGLSSLVGDLEETWQIEVGELLTGGTEGLVLAATRAGDEPVVLKIGVPGELKREARALQIADGRGYARLLAWDEARDALLLEKLGPKLIDLDLPVHEQIEIICETLQRSWLTVASPGDLMTGEEKARWLADFITEQWQTQREPFDKAIRDRAVAYAEEREAAFDPERSVLVHGDSHAWNTLKWRDAESGSPRSEFKLVDPDGLFAEPAYDLGISMREWNEELLAGDAAQLGRRRCQLLSELCSIDERSIWQWGFIERVSTGLFFVQLGQKASSLEYFATAASWMNT